MNRLFGTHIPATALRADPPTCDAFSSTTTFAPSSCAWRAVVNPASDPPTTTRSASRSQLTSSARSGTRTSGLPIPRLLISAPKRSRYAFRNGYLRRPVQPREELIARVSNRGLPDRLLSGRDDYVTVDEHASMKCY